MLNNDVLKDCSTFTKCDLPLGKVQRGKVRDSYVLPTTQRLLVTTDRLSAFDRIIGTVPYKGQVLNQLAAWWFQKTADIIPNHLIDLPDENAALVQNVKPYPVEVIVRGFITGVTETSLWRRYELGEREIYGHQLPENLKKNEALPTPLITPTTKGGLGLPDVPLTCDEVISQGWVNSADWNQIQNAAHKLFHRGQQLAQKSGLILVDTKYEFGLHPTGEILLIDEIHTPDSSRFWTSESYAHYFSLGLEPESFDKEFLRLQFSKIGYLGQGEPPRLAQAVWLELSRRYIKAYEQLTGIDFVPASYPVLPRLRTHLTAAGLLK